MHLISFCRVVLDLCIVSVCEHVKFGKKITSTNGATFLSLGSAFHFYVKQLLLLFTCS